MKQTQKTILTALLLIIVSITLYTQSHAAGLLKPVNQSSGAVEMKSHAVNVTINNGFARTEVDQVFINNTDTDLEAIYSFPVPKQASLSELSLWINGSEVLGEVLEKQKAKKAYDEQKSKGNNTAIAEKNDYKTFDVRVYPVTANDETRIRLVYYQPLTIDLGIGRYVYPLEDGNVDEERISFWETDNTVKQSFTFNAIVKSAFPIKDIRVPQFQNQAVITRQPETSDTGQQNIYHIRLEQNEGAELSKDIIIYYRLDDQAPARVELIPFRESQQTDGKFMLVITPGKDLQPISNGSDWIFVLDVSGSMGGPKLSTLIQGVRKSIQKMTPDHRFKIITFENQAKEITNGFVPATTSNIQQAEALLDSISSGGGTALFAGLEKAYKNLDQDRTTGIILVTDGVANVGPSTHAELLSLHRKYDCRLFTFVIGNSANQPLMETLAKESGGFSMNISSSDDLIGRILQAKAKMFHESLYDTQVRFHGERVTQVTPAELGNLYMGQQIVLFGSYGSSGPVKIDLTGRIGNVEKTWTTQAILPEQNTDNPEIERLWALSRIEEKTEKIRQNGESSTLRNEIIDLGVDYSLVTDYTSMVVLNDQEMENMGLKRKNASRVQKERAAQKLRANTPVKNYNVAQQDSNHSMFGNQSAPGVGTGAIGPLFIGLLAMLRRRSH